MSIVGELSVIYTCCYHFTLFNIELVVVIVSQPELFPGSGYDTLSFKSNSHV